MGRRIRKDGRRTGIWKASMKKRNKQVGRKCGYFVGMWKASINKRIVVWPVA